MSWTFEHVAGPVGFAEGPAWDGTGLLFSDIKNSRTMRYDPATGKTTVYREGTNEANGLTDPPTGRRWVVSGTSGRSSD